MVCNGKSSIIEVLLTTFHRREKKLLGLLGVLRGTSVGASTDSETNDGPGA